jgi:uncharacterized protein YpbB
MMSQSTQDMQVTEFPKIYTPAQPSSRLIARIEKKLNRYLNSLRRTRLPLTDEYLSSDKRKR